MIGDNEMTNNLQSIVIAIVAMMLLAACGKKEYSVGILKKAV